MLLFHFSFKDSYILELGNRLQRVHTKMLIRAFFEIASKFFFFFCLAQGIESQAARVGLLFPGHPHLQARALTLLPVKTPLMDHCGLTLPSKPQVSLPFLSLCSPWQPFSTECCCPPAKITSPVSLANAQVSSLHFQMPGNCQLLCTNGGELGLPK